MRWDAGIDAYLDRELSRHHARKEPAPEPDYQPDGDEGAEADYEPYGRWDCDYEERTFRTERGVRE
jgi:hypothetical protein